MPRILLLTASVGLLSSACTVYSPSNQSASRTTVVPESVASVSLLSAANATMIRAHYADDSRGNGRGRRGGLPPGIEKNLQRGKPLPPGIAKQHLPQDLLGRLPLAPNGLEYVVVAGKLLLVEIATQIVREVLLESVFG